MRKPAFCICENKDADQLRGNSEADQRLCFRYTDSTIPLLPKSGISSLWPFSVAVTARFVSDLVGNPEDRSSPSKNYNSEHQLLWRLKGSLMRLGPKQGNLRQVLRLFKSHRMRLE